MMLKQLAFAATASAFLITPEMKAPKNDEEGAFNILPIEESNVSPFIIPPDALEKGVKVPCAECRGQNSVLDLDFKVQDNKRLLVNGFEVYPSADPMHNDLTAGVTFDGGEKKEKLGYSLAVEPLGRDDEEDSELISVALHVIEVSAKFVEKVPSVTAKLLKQASGEILIADVEVKEPEEEEESHCTNIWCSAKEWMSKTMGSLTKPCPGKAGHKDAPKQGDTDGEMGISGWKSDEPQPEWDESVPHILGWKSGEPKPDVDESVPHILGWKSGEPQPEWDESVPHIMGEDDDEEHGVLEFFLSLVTHIIVPVIMGITVGISVAFIFMIVFTMVVRIGRFFRGDRRKRPSSRHQPATPQEVATEEEKTGLMENA